MPVKPEYSSYRMPNKVFGAAVQDIIPPDKRSQLDKDKVKVI